jgi:Uma2 family endonuclease
MIIKNPRIDLDKTFLQNSRIDLDKPFSQWPVFYKRGLPYIYDDTPFLYRKNGERMAEHVRHSSLAIYLRELLINLYRDQICTVTFNLFLRTKLLVKEVAAADGSDEGHRYVDITPDVALIKGVQHPDTATYFLGHHGPPPNIVFEIGSPRTYKEDLDSKWKLYAGALKAKEYVVYDPHEKRLWEGSRLKAWRLTKEGHYVELERDKRGWIWSEELESWLVEDETNLWLYDRKGNKRLIRAEQAEAMAEQERFRAEQAEAMAEQERLRAEQAETMTEQERLRAKQAEAQIQQEKLRTEQERFRAEQEKLRAEQLEARLRELEARLQKNGE